MENILYESINRANYDHPHIDLTLYNLQYPAHIHEELELMYVADGEIDFTNGAQRYTAHKGDIAVTLPFRIHSLETVTQSHVYIIKLLSGFFDFSAYTLDQILFSQGDDIYPALRANILRMAEESCLPDIDTRKHLAVVTAADEMLLCLSRLPHLTEASPDLTLAQNRDNDLLKRINLFLQENYMNPISLDDAAKACHISTYYFAHRFKRATGTTFGNYLNRIRLEQAKIRIMLEDELFTETAMKCGFSSMRMFNRSFVSYFKITPTQAKKAWRK